MGLRAPEESMIVVASALFDPSSSRPRMVSAIREEDLAEGLTPEAAAESQRLGAASNGAFVACTTLVVPEGTDIVGATIAANAWATGDATRLANLAMLFYWNQSRLEQVNPGGLLSGTIPVPQASVEDLERTLVALSRSPAYRDQRIVAIAGVPSASATTTPVAMRRGVVARLGADAAALLASMKGAGLRPKATDRLVQIVDKALGLEG